VRLLIECHGPGAALGGQILYYAKVVGVVFMYRGECAVGTIRTEGGFQSGVKGRRVRATANRQTCNLAAGLRIKYQHALIGADGEEPLGGTVDGQSGGPVA